MNEKILVVDDEESILELVAFNLTQAGYRLLTTKDGLEGLALARREKPDLIVLDVMLPGLDGLEICRVLRKETSVPILMLTARKTESDKVIGLDLGADDYLTKPFSPRELVARVKAVLRRTGKEELSSPDNLERGELVINPAKHELFVRGEKIDLTFKEFELLKLLASHPGRVFTREYLLERLWDDGIYSDSRTIDVHVRHLREKVEANPGVPEYIQTVRGLGYKFKEQA